MEDNLQLHESDQELDGGALDTRGFWKDDKLLVVLSAALALVGATLLLFLILPLLISLLNSVGIRFGFLNNYNQWFNSGLNGLLLVAGLAIVFAVIYLLLRARLLGNESLYVGAGCPQCAEHEFIRVRRRPADRLLSRAGIPVRRYVCRNCSWDGLRIGRPLPEMEEPALETPAADLQ